MLSRANDWLNRNAERLLGLWLLLLVAYVVAGLILLPWAAA